MKIYPIKVLLVDNNERRQTLICDGAKSMDYIPLVCPDIASAKAQIKKESKYLAAIFVNLDFLTTPQDLANLCEGASPETLVVTISNHSPQEIGESWTQGWKTWAHLKNPVSSAAVIETIENSGKKRLSELEEKSLLVSMFVDKMRSSLEDLEPLILSLEKNPKDQTTIQTIFRIIHTIKGSTDVLDTSYIYQFTQTFEDVLSLLNNRKIVATPDIITDLLKALDILKVLTDAVEDQNPQSFDIASLSKVFEKCLESAHDQHQKTSEVEISLNTKGNTTNTERDSIRIPTGVLDEFFELSGEITVIRNMVNRLFRTLEKEFVGMREVSHLGELLDEMHKINNRMQVKVSDLRKIPASHITKPLKRALRDLSQSTKKEFDLVIEGEHLKVDNSIMRALSDALIHLIRNSADHGIESKEERTRRGKSPVGHIYIRFAETRDEIRVEIGDDGQGLDLQKITNRALELQLASPGDIEKLSRSRLFSFIFEPGFTTTENVTPISGRGVGMDMVKNSVESLHGKIEVDSQEGRGTQFTITMPIPRSVRIINSVLVECGEQIFALPQSHVGHLMSLECQKRKEMIKDLIGAEVVVLDGETIPLVYLAKVLNLPGISSCNDLKDDEDLYLAVLHTDLGRFVLAIDRILDGEDIALKSLGSHFSKLTCYVGATFFGGGNVGLVLDPLGLAQIAKIALQPSTEPQLVQGQHTESIGVGAADCDLVTFRLGIHGNYGAMLGDIYRLEALPKQDIQYAGNQKLIVYRGQFMPLFNLGHILGFHEPERSWDELENVPTLVACKNGKYYGLMVEEIVDIARGDMNTALTLSQTDSSLTSIVSVDGQAVCIVAMDGVIQWCEDHNFKNLTHSEAA